MKKFMRNTNKWVLALLLVVFTAGCGSDNGNTPVAPSNDVAADAAIMSTFSLSDSSAINMYDGVINETAAPKTIDVVMPNGTTDLNLVATYDAIGEVKIGTEVQQSGLSNDFSGPVLYTVTSADGNTIATYEVNVTVEALDAAVMKSYSLDGVKGIISEDTKTITVLMPSDVLLTDDLIATFTHSLDASVKIVDAAQVSGVTPNNFSDFVYYTVTAADGIATAEYEVDVTVASVGTNPLAPELGEAGRFAILASQLITTTVGSEISNGDIGVEDQARTFMQGFTADGSEGAFTELTNGMSFGFDDDNASFPYPVKTATLPIGSAWDTTAAMLTQAKTDLGLAYTFLAADPNPNSPTQVCPIQLGGETLYRGVYKTAENVQITTGALTLDAEDDPTSVFIFSIDGNLTTGVGGDIILAGGALAENVYFRTGGATVIAANTFFKGNILAWSQINVDNLADINGRLFALTDQVTLISDIVTKP